MTRDPLVKEVGTFLRDLGFEAYWPNKPRKISEFKTPVTKPREIEVDIIAKLEKIGFLVEATTQKDKNKEKISKFLLKLKAIKNSSLSKAELAKLFSGIPEEKRSGFEDIKEWKAIYIGTSPELIYKNIKPEDFGAEQELKIINIDDWTYISKLAKVVGKYASFELLSFLGIESFLEKEYEDFRNFKYSQRLKGREITEIEGKSLRADIFSFAAEVDFLLKTCKVQRFYGLRDLHVKVYFQRMLDESKLKKIRDDFIKGSSERSFPTPITVILPPEVKPPEGKNGLVVPFKYGSLTIIDGQHRLYSYALLPSEVQRNAKILVNGIRFYTNDLKEIGRFSARTFMDINREQVRVKTSLLYSIAYDYMGETSNEALAGKVITLCNSDKNSPLHDLFEGRALGRRSKLEVSRISMVEVTKKLAKIIEVIRDPNSQKAKNVSKLLNKKSIQGTEEELIMVTKSLLDGYFKKVRKVFIQDWKRDTKSLIFKTKYVAAFIVILNSFIDKIADFNEMGEHLVKIKNNLKSNSEWGCSASKIPKEEQEQIFHKERQAIVPVSTGSTEIIAKSIKWYENHSEIWPELGRISQNGE